MNLIRTAALLGTAVLFLCACASHETQENPVPAAPVETAAPGPEPAEEPEQGPETELVWPEQEYTALDEEGQAAYRQAVEEQLAPGEYVLLPDGSVAENPRTGRYDPRTFLETFPGAALPRQQVGDYTLEQVQVGFRVDPAARAGDGTVRRYQTTEDNLLGATLVYRSGEAYMNFCLIGLRAWPPTGAAYTFAGQAVPVAEENGRTVYSLSGTLEGGIPVQLNGTGDSEETFAGVADAFAQAAPELLSAAS